MEIQSNGEDSLGLFLHIFLYEINKFKEKIRKTILHNFLFIFSVCSCSDTAMQLLQILVSTFLLNHSIKSIVNSSKLRVKIQLKKSSGKCPASCFVDGVFLADF
jgi:hypothetical protein